MKAFLWTNAQHLTSRYHDDGACLCFAETLEAAREAYRAEHDKLYGEVSESSHVLTRLPDHTWEVLSPLPIIPCHIFPDAGCC
jgi:hypothetical protein